MIEWFLNTRNDSFDSINIVFCFSPLRHTAFIRILYYIMFVLLWMGSLLNSNSSANRLGSRLYYAGCECDYYLYLLVIFFFVSFNYKSNAKSNTRRRPATTRDPIYKHYAHIIVIRIRKKSHELKIYSSLLLLILFLFFLTTMRVVSNLFFTYTPTWEHE